MALTVKERALLHLYVMNGPTALLDKGMDAKAIEAFIQRADVMERMEQLIHDYLNSDAAQSRQQFVGRRLVSALLPNAVAIVSKSLKGPQYAKNGGVVMEDHQGRPIIAQPEPTSNQLRAAIAVLDRVGVTPPDERGPSELAASVLRMAKAERFDVVYDEDTNTPQKQILSRERMRAALSRALPGIRKLLEKVDKRKRVVSATKKTTNPSA